MVAHEGYVVEMQKGGNYALRDLGGKAFSLAKMQELDLGNAAVPKTLVITADAYRHFIHENDLEGSIVDSLAEINEGDYDSIVKASQKIRQIIMQSNLPEELVSEIVSESCHHFNHRPLAVRSSATLEDLTGGSFAGMYDSFLGLVDRERVIEAVKSCYASLFNARALVYRLQKKQSLDDVSMAVILQEMVDTNESHAGVIFTYSKEHSSDKVITIDASYGNCQGIVQGEIEPDEYMVFKAKLGEGRKPIIDKHLGSKKTMIVVGEGTTSSKPTSEEQRKLFVMSDDEIIALAEVAKKIEDHYRQPVDIEWAKSSADGKLYVVQARPIAFKNKQQKLLLKEYAIGETREPLITGLAIGDSIGEGRVSIINSLEDSQSLNEGDVLVTRMTDPDWIHLMMRSSAIITEEGGRTSHPAIISRELGKPCIVGARNAISRLNSGRYVTVSCVEGPEGRVYDGKLRYTVTETRPDLPNTKTGVLMNINLSDIAFRYAAYPSDGVGMVREEFVISDKIGFHPLALINYEELKKDLRHRELVQAIEEKSRGYKSPADFYVGKLAQSLGKIAAAFYPREVIVKLTDFKSNEYRSIPGGEIYEPVEDNPLIGWRSAVRFYSPEYRPAFKLECEALRQVREVMGLENIHPMIPFCRTPEEGRVVLDTLAEYGLPRGKNGLKVIAEVEVPVSIILMDQYAILFDGFQIGSNCLTQSILCLDRNSTRTAHLFNENHPAMRAVISEAIKKSHNYGKTIGIVGQAPSDIPDFTRFLVEQGIDSISLNPDPQTFIKMRKLIYEVEQKT